MAKAPSGDERGDKGQLARMAALGVGASVAAFCVFGGLSGLGKTGPGDPFDAVPRASFIAATLDFAELRQSPVYDVLFGREAPGADPMRRALGVTALADACGFDPTTRVQRVAVSVPEEGDRGEFGVAAKVEVSRDELETCTRSLAEKRGAKAETHDVGTFVVLDGANGAARLAYGRGGLLVVGKGTWFDAMLGAADHTKPGLRDAAPHMALRSSLTSREGFRSPTLVATAILPRSLRDRLKGEMGAETSGGGDGANDASNAIMAGVLGVSAVGVAVKAGGRGQNIDAAVELVCDDDAACEAVEKLAQKKRGEWSRDLAMRMIGFGPLLDSLQVKRTGAHLVATASVSSDALASTIERVLKLRGRQGGGAATPMPPLPKPPSVAPDERVPARDAGH